MKIQRMASVFKDSMKTAYILAHELEKGSKVLVTDGLDGWNVFPFSSEGHYVTTYEPDEKFLLGGETYYDDSKCIVDGLKKRIEVYKQEQLIQYYHESFFEDKVITKYNAVYAFRTLGRKCYENLTISEKIEKLKEVVADDGHLYIYYHLAIDELDYEKYPKNLFLRESEIISYFDFNEWELIYFKERKKLRVESGHLGKNVDELYRIGYIQIVRKKKKYLADSTFVNKYNWHYKIRMSDSHIIHSFK